MSKLICLLSMFKRCYLYAGMWKMIKCLKIIKNKIFINDSTSNKYLSHLVFYIFKFPQQFSQYVIKDKYVKSKYTIQDTYLEKYKWKMFIKYE